MADIPAVLAGRYEVRKLIGRGGMAEVHIGYDKRLSRTVAIKILRADLAQDPLFLARFRREAQSAAALNHPSIVSVYDTGEEQVASGTPGKPPLSLPYIIMEYVNGRTVSSLLVDGDPVPIAEAVQIAVGVLNALEYSHHEGIIHRDIKPGNIMLTPDGKVKVMDFGIARAIADSAATMTKTNSVVGTAQYLSPEQARGEVVDARSDLYSTGCLLYELLTGKPPFVGESAVAVAYQHVQETPRPASQVASDIPDAIDRVVMKSLAKRREDRYQSAAEFREDLLSAARGEGVNAPSVTSWNMKPVPAPYTQAMPAGYNPTATMAGTTFTPGGPVQFPATQVASTTAQIQAQADRAQAAREAEEKNKKRMRMWIALIVILVLAGVGVGVYALMNTSDDTPSDTQTTHSAVEVPDVVNMSETKARAALEEVGLNYRRGEDVASDTVEEGKAVSSEPEAGKRVTEGYEVVVHFSSGPNSVTVPDLKGKTSAEARAALEEAGLKLGTVTSADVADGEADHVVSQAIKAGETAEKNTAVDITVASGKVPVPNLSGKTLSQAQEILAAANLQASLDIKKVESSTTTPDTIVSQQPAAGTVVQQKSFVTITIATAPAKLPTEQPSATPDVPDPSPTPTANQ